MEGFPHLAQSPLEIVGPMEDLDLTGMLMRTVTATDMTTKRTSKKTIHTVVILVGMVASMMMTLTSLATTRMILTRVATTRMIHTMEMILIRKAQSTGMIIMEVKQKIIPQKSTGGRIDMRTMMILMFAGTISSNP